MTQSAGTIRSYDVVALATPIAYNDYGDHDRRRALYTLAEDADELRAVAASWPDPFPDYTETPEDVPKLHPLARPLVLRVRRGERLEAQHAIEQLKQTCNEVREIKRRNRAHRVGAAVRALEDLRTPAGRVRSRPGPLQGLAVCGRGFAATSIFSSACARVLASAEVS